MDIIEGFLFIMEAEIWKDVPDYEGMYQVSNLGRVKSLKLRKCIMSPNINPKGYERYSLFKDNKPKKYFSHQLVAIAFLGHSLNGNVLVVDHINGNKADNNLSNLRIVTNRFNCTIGHKKNKENKSSKYMGVGFHKLKSTWRARILINGKDTHLGYFKTELEASNAYQRKLLELNI